MISLNNFSITVRTLLLPLLGAVSILAVAVGLWKVVEANNQANLRLEEAISVNRDVYTALLTLSRGDVSLYRSVSWKGAQVEAAKIDDSIATFGSQIKKTEDVLAALSQSRWADKAANARTALGRYRSSANSVLNLIDADVSLANMGLYQVGVDYGAVEKGLVEVTEQTAANLREIKKQVGAEGDATVKIVAGMIILTLVISIVLGLWLGRSITRPIQVLTRTMTHLAGGDLDVVVEGPGRRDELGEMARALKVLQGVSQRQEVQTWAKDNLAALVADLQATSDSADFARALLSHLARSIPLFYGALYVTDPGGRSLARVGGYAVGYALEEKRFALGEGLIGQSAVDMQPLTICGVADGNPLIAIGLGGWKARALIILPVVVRGAATAVLELVPMEPLNQRQQILIEVLMPTLALNVEIMNAATRRRQGIEAPQVLAVG